MQASHHIRRAAVALALLSLAAGPVAAQTKSKGSVSSSESVTAKVTVQSIDREKRLATVVNDAGETTVLVVPPEARNLDQLKPGDKVKVSYTLATEFVISAPNAALPEDTIETLEARTAKGELPGGAVATQVVVTGAVLAIDTAKHTLKLVSPQGGAVHSVLVKTPEGRRAMAKIKVGDTITAYVTESMMLSVEPL